MSESILFLVGAGTLPELKMQAASKALSNCWGGDLMQHCCGEDPNNVLKSLIGRRGLVRLSGDVAMSHPKRAGSWLEALGAWRQPLVLMCEPNLSGDIPGNVAAYAALCSSLSAPLIGIIQVGGCWKSSQRVSDSLPWCGWLPDSFEQGEHFANSNSIEISRILYLRLNSL